MHQSAYIIRFLKGRITSKYGRHKLANDGTRFGAGQAIVTPSIIRNELIAAYSALERQGIVENMEAFQEHLIVERDAQNPNRVNILFPPDYVNQLRVVALLNQFRQQYPDAS
ncbi:Phage tail sheath protein [compost metagenome]